MPDLSFEVISVEPMPYAVTPTLSFKIAVANAVAGEEIQSVQLRCQIQIEATRRRYDNREQANLADLYGEPSRWGQTLRALHWTNAHAVVRPFEGKTTLELPVECTFDFNVATTKYFNGLESGELPLNLLFSGTVFYYDAEGALQAGQISWEQEAKYRLPLSVWKEMMDLYYPNSAWLNLRRDVFDKLNEYKTRNSIPTWEQALERVLDAVPAPAKANGNGQLGEGGTQ